MLATPDTRHPTHDVLRRREAVTQRIWRDGIAMPPFAMPTSHAAMSTKNISLPDSLKSLLDEQVSEYVRKFFAWITIFSGCPVCY